jgi:hypothetical protein
MRYIPNHPQIAYIKLIKPLTERLKRKNVAKIQRKKNAFQIMEAIRSTSAYSQMQIYLAGGSNYAHNNASFLPEGVFLSLFIIIRKPLYVKNFFLIFLSDDKISYDDIKTMNAGAVGTKNPAARRVSSFYGGMRPKLANQPFKSRKEAYSAPAKAGFRLA